MIAKTPTCPSCFRPGGALTAKPHCASENCSWNICDCKTTYDRKTLAGFGNNPKPVHYPAPEAK
jgi:hypothetical protein